MSEYDSADFVLIFVASCKTVCILWNFDKHFSLRKLRQILCLVFIHSYKVQFVNRGFEIMVMKKCAAISFSMHVKDLHTKQGSIQIFVIEKP